MTPAGKRKPTRRAPRKRAPTKRDSAIQSLLTMKADAGSAVGAILRADAPSPVDALCPPGSLLERVVRVIRQETDCPPMMALVTVFAVLSGALCQARSTYVYEGETQRIHPSLWLVLLAESGAGKSFVRRVLCRALGVQLRTLPNPASAKAYLLAMQDAGGRAYWDRDEYGQAIKQLNQPGATDLKDELLRTYDHTTLTNMTKADGVLEIADPCLVIYGATPAASLGQCVSLEMLVDGFAARHLWVSADDEPLRVYRYDEDRIVAGIGDHEAIDALRNTLGRESQYVITRAANAELQRLFSETVSTLGEGLSRGFVRRITYAAGTYAVLYHVLTRPTPRERIDVHSVRWAWRMVMYHLHSTQRVLHLVDPKLSARIALMMEWLDAKQREGVTGRQLVRQFLAKFHRDVSDAAEAIRMMQICGVKCF